MKILVTGGHGFLGKHVQKALYDAPWAKTMLVPGREVDWLDEGRTGLYFLDNKPDVVIHLAALVGGIGANRARPADFWYQNLKMGMNIIEECRDQGVKKLVMVATTCGYPVKPKTIPFVEEEFFDGYPEPTNAPYGIAKRCLLAGLIAYRQQYGLDSTTLIPTNIYGPGDHYDLEKSHVIPALIRKFHEAKERNKKSVTLWGTGAPTRDFLYVEDAAKAIVGAIGSKEAGPFNLGSGSETSIRQLAELVRGAVRFEGSIIWDHDKPDGQPRRCLNPSKAECHLGWKATTKLEEGLRATYLSYFREVAAGNKRVQAAHCYPVPDLPPPRHGGSR